MEDDVRYKTDYLEGEVHKAFATNLGHAMRLLASCPRRELSVKAAVRGLWPAIQLGQILFLYNSKGIAVAYATWMHVTEEVASSLRECPEDTLDVSERNEGDLLWITDIVAPFGDIRALVKKMRRCVPLNGGIVRGSRWNEARKERRLIEVSVSRC
jgi:hemolysin-activating ACP:hemolysin acyltransferase